MSDCLKGTPESIEDEFGEAIVSRDESLVLLAASPGLGPPDLCWLQKAAKGSWSTVGQEPRGYYHHCLGNDVSSSAAVSAYFASLTSKVEPLGFLQGLWHTAEMRIERGFYCTYDPFSRLDVRCELCVPGGVVCGALDAEGSVHKVTPELWRNVLVASFMRAQLYDADLITHADNVKRFDPVGTPQAERRLLAAVEEMYSAGVLPEALELISLDEGRGCTAEHMDLVLLCVLHHFARRQRWHSAVAFFARLEQVHPAAAVYTAAAHRELDSFEASFSALGAALDRDPANPQLLVALGNECMYAEQLDMAAKLARRAIRVDHSMRPAWLLLVRSYTRMGLYSLALITLNVVPPPPVPAAEQEMLFVVPPPVPKSVTQPSRQLYDPELSAARQMAEEESNVDCSRGLLYLPAAVMVNREALDCSHWPDVGPHRLTRSVLAAAYGLLQELVAAVGWDNFLAMRARVFVMHEDASRSSPARGSSSRAAGSWGLVAGPYSKGHPDALDRVLEDLAAMGMSEVPEEAQAERTQRLAEWQQQQGAQGSGGGASGVGAAGAAGTPGMARTSAHLEADTGAVSAADAAAGEDIVDLSAMVASQAAGAQAGGGGSWQQPGGAAASASALPASINGSSSLWSVVFGGNHNGSRARAALDPATQASLQARLGAGPLGESAEELEARARLPLVSSARHAHRAAACSADGATFEAPWRPACERRSAYRSSGHPGASAHRGSRTLAVRAGKQLLRKLRRALHARKAGGAAAAGHDRGHTHPRSSGNGGGSTGERRHRRYAPDAPSFIIPAACASIPAEAAAYDSSGAAANGLSAPAAAPAAYQRPWRRLLAPPGPLAEGQEPPAPSSSLSRPLASSSGGGSGSIAGSESSASDELAAMQRQHAAAAQLRAVVATHHHAASSGGGAAGGLAGGLRSLESDREAAILGKSIGEGDHGAKRICVRWLDELIIALWHDLQAYMEWKAQDARMVRSQGNTLARLLLKLPPEQQQQQQQQQAAAAQEPLPQLSAVDWMRRGLLAERLCHDGDALLAYRCCTAVGGFNTVACTAITRLALQAGDNELALATAHQILAWHEGKLPASAASSGNGPRLPSCPLAVEACVMGLLARVGPEGLEQLASQSGAAVHPGVQQLVAQFRTWGQ